MSANYSIKQRVLAAIALAMAATSCTVGPDYKRPDERMPTTFKSAATHPTTTEALQNDWWKLFGDEELTKLEEAALAANPDIQAAMARVEEARVAAEITGAQFYPVITLDPTVTRGRSIVNHSVINGSPLQNSATNSQYRIAFDLTYEVDIWGRIRRAYEAAKAQYQATAIDLEVVRLTLEADVAQNYFSLRSLDAQDKILSETVDAYRKQLALTRTQLHAGLVGPTDQAQAEAVYNATSALELEARRQRADTEHALAILIGRPPSELDLALNPLESKVPVIPADLPANLLKRRPDVAEAEQNLIAANAQIGEAKALLYPTLNLTGAAGFESFDVQHSLNWENRIWSVGAGVSAPIFEGGRLRANVREQEARYKEVAAAYRSSVLGAIRDVEDSLTDLHNRSDQSAAQDAAVKASREYLRLSQTQYKQGLVSYLQVIDAERTLLANKLTQQQTLNLSYTSSVLLIKAMGGGWEAAPESSKK